MRVFKYKLLDSCFSLWYSETDGVYTQISCSGAPDQDTRVEERISTLTQEINSPIWGEYV